MQVRLGYVAMALALEDASPSKTVTFTNLKKIPREHWGNKLEKIAQINLEHTLRILRYNLTEGIHVYRLTSKLIPLATHPELAGWNWLEPLRPGMAEIGEFARKSKMRLSAHPDHFTVLSSPSDEVTLAAIRDLEYHQQIFKGMGLDDQAKLVLHIGGTYRHKDKAMFRFVERVNGIVPEIRARLTLENDDKNYSIGDLLEIGQELNLPVVFDLHHHRCYNQGEELSQVWPSIVSTWKETGLPPKIHLSSPKNTQEFRSHADWVAKEDFLSFLPVAAELGEDFDLMVEAKQKSEALLKLLSELAIEPGITKLAGAVLSIDGV